MASDARRRAGDKRKLKPIRMACQCIGNVLRQQDFFPRHCVSKTSSVCKRQTDLIARFQFIQTIAVSSIGLHAVSQDHAVSRITDLGRIGQPSRAAAQCFMTDTPCHSHLEIDGRYRNNRISLDNDGFSFENRRLFFL